MERLTIKELAPYVEHDIKGLLTPQKEIVTLTGIFVDKFGLHEVQINYNGCYALSRFKPLLRPLSSLTDEIEHNGERFVPMVEIKNSEYYSHYELEDFVRNSFSYGSLNSLSYQLITKLHEWHFDVFGLIDRGIALPIDGKEVKP